MFTDKIREASSVDALTDSLAIQAQGGKGRKGGTDQIRNADFVSAIFADLPEGAFAAVSSKIGDPSLGSWSASRADLAASNLAARANNYLGCSSFFPADDGSFRARKSQFAACHFLMLDDLGTKVPLVKLQGFELSWLIETSPGNYQGGIILAEPLTNGDEAVRLLNALIEAGFCDAGASGPLSRWARLPVAINGKPKYTNKNGAPFQCRLTEWRPDKRYTPQEIVHGLHLELAPAGRPRKNTILLPNGAAHRASNDVEEVLTPKAAEKPGRNRPEGLGPL